MSPLRTTALAVTAATMATVPASGYKFMAIGDWGASYEGGTGTDCSGSIVEQQAADAVQMGKYAAANKIDEVFLLGDNFYGSGIHGDCHNCRFQKTFEDIYNASSLENVPFYVCAGNHDHLGNVQAQIDYTNLSHRWKFPNYYYTITKNFTDSTTNKVVTAQFVLIDTVLLDTLDQKYGKYSDAPGAEVPDHMPPASQQWKWIESTLAASTADYLWVGGHYPVWSGCEHGPTDVLVEKLKPMLEKYKVSGYMCGHDHCQEYIDEGKGPVYVLTGAGFECCYKGSNMDKVPSGAIKMAYWDGSCPAGAECPPKTPNTAFTVFDTTAESMTITMIDSSGKTLFQAPPVKPRTTTKLTQVSQL